MHFIFDPAWSVCKGRISPTPIFRPIQYMKPLISAQVAFMPILLVVWSMMFWQVNMIGLICAEAKVLVLPFWPTKCRAFAQLKPMTLIPPRSPPNQTIRRLSLWAPPSSGMNWPKPSLKCSLLLTSIQRVHQLPLWKRLIGWIPTETEECTDQHFT